MSESNQSEITDPTDPVGAGAADVDDSVDADRVNERAHLLPEEIVAGSDDPQQQAEIILQESAERTLDVEGTQESSTQVP
jgi:hypothetical protein